MSAPRAKPHPPPDVLAALPLARLRVLPLSLLLLALVMALLPACNHGPSPAQAAYQSLKRLETKASRAASYDDFTGELDSARAAVNLYLASETARRDSQLAAQLQEVLFAYELSAKLWHILRQVGQSSVAGNIKRVCIRRASAAGQELAAYLESLGALPSPGSDGCPYEEVEITRQMGFLWEHSSKLLRSAGRALGP